MCKSCDEKSNHKSKKEKSSNKKRNKCPENNGKKEDSPKCPKRKRPRVRAKKCLTRIEKIMLRIQPPIADRERFLHPEHVNCFLEESERVYIPKLKCGPCPSERPKVCGDGTKKRRKPNEDAEGKTHKDDDETKDEAKTVVKDEDAKTENEKEGGAGSGAEKQKGEEKTKGEENKEKIGGKKGKGETKKNKKKKKREIRKRKEDIKEGSDSEMSIGSNDSEVCLDGVGLTKDDKDNIEENRRKKHPPPKNEEKGVHGTDDVEAVTTQESGNTQ